MKAKTGEPLSLERLIQDASGDLLYRFRRPWSDGTTGIKLSALELIEKLAALVPPSIAHLVHYSGWGAFEKRG